MPTRPDRLRVVVVGGGVIGASAAAHLVRAGADVTLMTDGAIASGASGRSLSWLNSFGNYRSADYHRLRVLGIDRYRTLAARVRSGNFLRFDGALNWPATGQTEDFRAHLRHMHDNGYEAHWLAPEELDEWMPGVDPAAVSPDGAIFNPGEGWVDLPSLIEILVREVRAAGTVVENAGPVHVAVDGGRATGVAQRDGRRVDADAVLLATGPAVPAALAELGLQVPDATTVSLLVKTRPVNLALRAVLNTPHVSLRPTPDGALAMDSDAVAQQVNGDEQRGYEVEDATVDELLAQASAVLAGHPQLEAEWFGVGPKPIPGDGDPVLGAVDEIPGLSVAFTHSGATLALIAGELLAREIVTGSSSALLAPFALRRFTRR